MIQCLQRCLSKVFLSPTLCSGDALSRFCAQSLLLTLQLLLAANDLIGMSGYGSGYRLKQLSWQETTIQLNLLLCIAKIPAVSALMCVN
jgi:hypothetical protein